MTDPHLLGTFIRRSFLEHVIADRDLSRNTQRSYRDAILLLLRFMKNHHRIDAAHFAVEHLTAAVVRDFLAYLERERANASATVNQRLTAIHSLVRFIAGYVPELVDFTTHVQAVPLRRVPRPTVPYLEKAEIDALLATHDRRRRQGQRDYALLLFLYNTGARADEAAHTTRGSLGLGQPASVRIAGKGRKTRLCPLWGHTAEVLRLLLGHRLDGPADACVCQRTRSAVDAIRRLCLGSADPRHGSQAAPFPPRKAGQPPLGEALSAFHDYVLSRHAGLVVGAHPRSCPDIVLTPSVIPVQRERSPP